MWLKKELIVACSAIWGMTEYYNEVLLKQADITRGLKRGLETDDTEQVKKVKLDDGTELYDLPLKYNRLVI